MAYSGARRVEYPELNADGQVRPFCMHACHPRRVLTNTCVLAVQVSGFFAYAPSFRLPFPLDMAGFAISVKCVLACSHRASKQLTTASPGISSKTPPSSLKSWPQPARARTAFSKPPVSSRATSKHAHACSKALWHAKHTLAEHSLLLACRLGSVGARALGGQVQPRAGVVSYPACKQRLEQLTVHAYRHVKTYTRSEAQYDSATKMFEFV